jgi:hypothetical protein
VKKVPGSVFTTFHFLQNLQIGPISTVLYYTFFIPGWKNLPVTNTLAYFAILYVKKSIVNTAPGTLLTTPHFLCNLQIGPISRDIIQGWKSLLLTNSLAYFAIL